LFRVRDVLHAEFEVEYDAITFWPPSRWCGLDASGGPLCRVNQIVLTITKDLK